MPITNPHELSVVEVRTSTMSSATVLGGLEDLNVQSGTEARGGATSGTLYSEHESIAAQRPEITFTSVASLATLLNLTGSLGGPLTAGANVGLAAYIVKRLKGSSYATGAAHRRYRIADGILIPTSLRAGFQDDARLSCRAVAIYDGSNPPIQEQDLVSIPAAPVRNERFSLYHVVAGGIALVGATSVEIDFGLSVILSEGATGVHSELIWPTHASINQATPTITISGINPEWLKSTNIPRDGKSGTHAQNVIYLARRKHGSTFYGAAENQHITISTAGLVYIDQVVTASDKANGTVSLMIRSIFDGVNAPLVITTATDL